MKNNTETIWEKFSPQLRNFIQKKVSDASVSEDILQEVFRKIHIHLGQLKNDEKVESWIYQITRNTITDQYRTQKSIEELPQDLSIPDKTLHKIDCKTGVTSIKAIMESLPEPYSEALVLTEFEGLTQKELAKKLGISLSGAKSRVQRGRKMLKAELEKCCRISFDRHGTIVDYQCSDYFLSWYKKLS